MLRACSPAGASAVCGACCADATERASAVAAHASATFEIRDFKFDVLKLKPSASAPLRPEPRRPYCFAPSVCGEAGCGNVEDFGSSLPFDCSGFFAFMSSSRPGATSDESCPLIERT